MVLKDDRNQASLIFTDGFNRENCMSLSPLLLDEGLNLPHTKSLMPAASTLRRLARRSNFSAWFDFGATPWGDCSVRLLEKMEDAWMAARLFRRFISNLWANVTFVAWVMSSWVSGSNRIPKPFFLASVSSLATRFFWACYMEYKLIYWWVPFDYWTPLSPTNDMRSIQHQTQILKSFNTATEMDNNISIPVGLREELYCVHSCHCVLNLMIAAVWQAEVLPF